MSSARLEKGAGMAAIGWLEMESKRDAIEYAKSYATRHMNSVSSSWYAVAPLLGGWLWEVQEGDVGKSHIPDIIKALSAGVEVSWFRVGRRAYTVSMRDGRPFPVLLPEKESRELLASSENRLNATGRMERVVKTGAAVLALGLAVFIAGGVFLGSTAAFYAMSQRYVPMDRQVAAGTLPHNQWAKVQRVPPNLFVESLRLTEGSTEWQAVIKPIQQAPAKAPVGGAVEPAPVGGNDAQVDQLKVGSSLPEPVAAADVPAPAAPTVDGGQTDVPASPVPPQIEE